MRVAIVHDWLTGMRGGERVLEAMLELHPDAHLFTLVHAPGSVSPCIERHPIHTSLLQRLPAARTHWRYYLPLYPLAVATLDVRDYDLVLSSSHCAAKAVRRRPDALHISYCHTPMRYVWDQYDAYFGRGAASRPVRMAMRVVAPPLRRWDRRTAGRVDVFIANSRFVAGRIRRHYGRDAVVIHPPVDVDRFAPAGARDDFYLIVSALVPYKRIDLAVEAFRLTDRRLVIVGDGPESARLRAAAPPNVELTGRLPDEDVERLLSRCRGFLLPGEEDFGIAAVEAQAAGAPVIAFGRGGACETVIDGSTGVLFRPATPEALLDAIEKAEHLPFDPAQLVRHARRFAPERFRRELRRLIDTTLAGVEPETACVPSR